MIAIIPARGGSKGILRKNISLINGIPLLVYSIKTGLNCKSIRAVYVSTEDSEIKEVALRAGAKVIDRPEEYAQDTSTDIDVLLHAVEYLNVYSNLIYLRPTTPLRKISIIEEAIKYFNSNTECTSLRSAHECPETAYKYFKVNGKYWKGLFDNELSGAYYDLPRQLLPKTYHPNGYIDIVKPTYFLQENNSCYGNKILSFITPYTIDIDTKEDLKKVEYIINDTHKK